MPSKAALRMGIGTKGVCLKRFLHPKANRKRIWPVDDEVRFSDVEVVDKSEKRVGNKTQKVYDVKVPRHPDVSFYVVCCHFSVKVAAETVFDDERPARPDAGATEGGGGGGWSLPGDQLRIQAMRTCREVLMRRILPLYGPAA